MIIIVITITIIIIVINNKKNNINNITTYLHRVNPSAEAIIKGCLGQLKIKN